MGKKKIAVLIGQADEDYQKEFLKGLLETAFARDISVRIFSMFIKYQNSPEREIGDAVIFSLADPASYDGIIIMSDTIQTPGVEKKIEQSIHEKFDGPVLCIDCESEYFESFWTDGYQGVYDSISHLIEEHGIDDIAYLTGRSGHTHSIRRLQAYKDAMKDHGLSVRDDRVFYGDFWYTSGAGLGEEFLHDKKKMPKAIACANDCMALGLAKILDEGGVRIPEDIIITGYGSGDEGRLAPKSITSVEIPSQEYGAYALESLMDMMNDKPIKQRNIPYHQYIGESCGCCQEREPERRREGFGNDNSDEGFFSIHNTMEEDMLRCDSLEDILTVIYENIHYIRGVKSLDLCLCD
ncbi:MAG: substrate-binding domain-containing protein, partial [Lachnospiraceae bacterium]|nr:substrate-binding domain-containing protein [Lachnospiraceae bacterium]